jgi:hypothetical protein
VCLHAVDKEKATFTCSVISWFTRWYTFKDTGYKCGGILTGCKEETKTVRKTTKWNVVGMRSKGRPKIDGEMRR